jgi:transcriptional regulator with XRE-family HTH domain
MHVGSNLRRARREAGLSQAELAERSGISRRTIVNAEAGEANMSLTGVDQLAGALGTTFTALVTAPSAVKSAINEVVWRGNDPASVAVIHAAAPSRLETQLWTWALGVGERYDAQPDPPGWHEMLLVTEGSLDLICETPGPVRLTAGEHVVFSSAQAYSYANASAVEHVKFVRVVVN